MDVLKGRGGHQEGEFALFSHCELVKPVVNYIYRGRGKGPDLRSQEVLVENRADLAIPVKSFRGGWIV